MRKASTVLPACAHDLVGGTVLGRIDGHGHVIGQHVGRRRVDDDFGLLARGLVDGEHRHQRHVLRGFGLGRQRGLAGDLGGVVGFDDHAAGTAAVDHSHLGRARDAVQFHAGDRCGGCGHGHQCCCGGCRKETLFHVDSCMHLLQVRGWF